MLPVRLPGAAYARLLKLCRTASLLPASRSGVAALPTDGVRWELHAKLAGGMQPTTLSLCQHSATSQPSRVPSFLRVTCLIEVIKNLSNQPLISAKPNTRNVPMRELDVPMPGCLALPPRAPRILLPVWAVSLKLSPIFQEMR